MKNEKWLLSGAVTLAMFLSVACRHSGEEKFKPSALMAGLYSGQSLQTVERKLGLMAGSFDILEDRKPLPSDTRPPYRLLVISKKNSRMAGQTGELVLTFFDDRLMTTQFFPEDIAAARASVESGQELTLGGGEAHIKPSTRVWVGKDESGRSYIGWIDKALQAEQDAWEKRYESDANTGAK